MLVNRSYLASAIDIAVSFMTTNEREAGLRHDSVFLSELKELRQALENGERVVVVSYPELPDEAPSDDNREENITLTPMNPVEYAKSLSADWLVDDDERSNGGRSITYDVE